MSDTAPTTALAQQGSSLITTVNNLQVIDAGTFEHAAALSRQIAGFIKRVEEVMEPICRATDVAHRTAVAQRDGLLRPAQGAKRVLGERMTGWEREIENRRRAAEDAQRKERERLEQEARAAAAAEQRHLQAIADQAAAAVAEQLAADGEPDLAGLVKAPVVPTPPPAPVYVRPVVTEAAPRSAGVAFRTTWSAQVDDLMTLIKAAAEGRVPLSLVMADQVELNKWAVRHKDQLKLVVPGVSGKETRSTSTRTTPAGVEW